MPYTCHYIHYTQPFMFFAFKRRKEKLWSSVRPNVSSPHLLNGFRRNFLLRCTLTFVRLVSLQYFTRNANKTSYIFKLLVVEMLMAMLHKIQTSLISTTFARNICCAMYLTKYSGKAECSDVLCLCCLLAL
jgi:hypothetical protein